MLGPRQNIIFTWEDVNKHYEALHQGFTSFYTKLVQNNLYFNEESGQVYAITRNNIQQVISSLNFFFLFGFFYFFMLIIIYFVGCMH